MSGNLAQKQKDNIGFNSVQLFLLVVLFFAAMNLFNKYYYLVLAAFCVFLLCCNRLKLDESSIFLLFLSFNIAMFSPGAHTSVNTILKSFAFTVCYIFGFNFLNSYNTIKGYRKAEKQLYAIIIIFALGTFVHLLLNLMNNLGSDTRNTVDIWMNDTMSATLQATVSCLSLALFVSIFFTNQNALIKTICVFALLIVFYYTTIIASRTLIVLFILLVLLCIVFTYKYTKNKIRFAQILFSIAFLVFVFVIIYLLDLFSVQTMFKESNLYKRFFSNDSMGLMEDSRSDAKLRYLNSFGDYFWGGAHLRKEYGYAHDIFLDTYDDAGILAFFSIIIYVVYTVKRLFTCLRDQTISIKLKLMVLCVYFVSYVEFFVEPILLGMAWYFGCFCFIDGALARFLKYKQQSKNNIWLNGENLNESSAN